MVKVATLDRVEEALGDAGALDSLPLHELGRRPVGVRLLPSDAKWKNSFSDCPLMLTRPRTRRAAPFGLGATMGRFDGLVAPRQFLAHLVVVRSRQQLGQYTGL